MTVAHPNNECNEKDHQIFNIDKDLSSFDNLEYLEQPLCVPHDSLQNLDYWFSLWSSTDPISIDFMISNSSESQKKESQQHDNIEDDNEDDETEKRRSNMQINHGCLQYLLKLDNKSIKFRKCRTKFRKKMVCANEVKDEGRKCSHCESTDTPQWRTGPLGPKSLCNACGVRYKSGRLFPEYRPAKSPTYDVKKHSNLHKERLRTTHYHGSRR